MQYQVNLLVYGPGWPYFKQKPKKWYHKILTNWLFCLLFSAFWKKKKKEKKRRNKTQQTYINNQNQVYSIYGYL